MCFAGGVVVGFVGFGTSFSTTNGVAAVTRMRVLLVPMGLGVSSPMLVCPGIVIRGVDQKRRIQILSDPAGIVYDPCTS